MLDVELYKLDQAVTELQQHLRDGLVAVDILDRTSGLSLASFNSNSASQLFPMLADTVSNVLDTAGFPALNRYLLLDLEGGHWVLVLRAGDDMMATLLLDSAKTSLGMLLGVAVPKALENIEAARR